MRLLAFALILSLLAGCRESDEPGFVKVDGHKLRLDIDGHEYVLIHTKECKEKDDKFWAGEGFSQ